MGSSAFCLGLLAEVSVHSQSYGQNPQMHSPLKGLILNVREKVLLHFASCHRQGVTGTSQWNQGHGATGKVQTGYSGAQSHQTSLGSSPSQRAFAL